jgi:hypothetical protein
MTCKINLLPGGVSKQELEHIRAVLLLGMASPHATKDQFGYANDVVRMCDNRLSEMEHSKRAQDRLAADPAKFTIHREVL